MVIPRSVASGLVAAVLGAAHLSGCGLGREEPIQVAVVWSGSELEQFRQVVSRFEEEESLDIDVVSAGDDIDGFLRARARADNLPDVAVLSRPGLIDTYLRREWLQPLDERLASRYAAFWENLGRNDDPSGPLYGAWVKGSYKSLFWYQPEDLAAADVPQDWASLQDQVGLLAGGTGPPPLAIGAADSWVLTDWLENLLLARSTSNAPGLYQRLAAGEAAWCDDEAIAALAELAGLWDIDGAFAGGGERALLTQFDESVIQVAAAGEGVMLQGSESVQALTGGVLAPDESAGGAGSEQLESFAFPSPTGVDPVLLGGDVAVVMKDSRRGEELVTWLTEPGSFTSWIEAGGYLSPLRDAVGTYPDPGAVLAPRVAVPTGAAQFDLSDQLGGAVGGQIGPVLQRLFSDVAIGTGNTDTELVAALAAGRLNEAAGGEAC